MTAPSAGHPVADAAPPHRFDAFISYSHSADGELAPALRRGLHQLAKPWYRVRATKIFVDEASLSTSPALWLNITTALSSSHFFVLLCSPEAARSEWVDKEVAHWLANRSAGNLLPVLTSGELVWDPVACELDMVRSTAAPPALRCAFHEEPRHLDVRWTRGGNGQVTLSLQNSRFKDAVADLAAPIHGVPKDDLVGEDVRQNLRTRRLARAAVSILCILLLVSVVSAGLARSNAIRAEHRRIDSEARRLGLEATGLVGPPDLAFTLADEGYRLRPTAVTTRALIDTAEAAPQIEKLFRPRGRAIRSIMYQRATGRILSVDSNGSLIAMDERSGKPLAESKTAANPLQLLQGPGGILVVTRDGFHVHDELSLAPIDDADVPRIRPVTSAAVVGDGVAIGGLGEHDDGELWWTGSKQEPVASGYGAPVAVSADGRAMIALFSDAGHQSASVRHFERTNNEWTQSWAADVPATNTVMTANPATRQIAIGSTRGDVTFIDMDSGNSSDPLSVGTSAVFSLAYLAGRAIWVAGDASGTIHWIDAETRQITASWSVHNGAVTTIIALDDSTYVSGGADGTLARQRISPLRKLAATTIPLGSEGFSVDAHPESGVAYAGTVNRLVEVNLLTNRVVASTDIDSVVYSVALLPGSSGPSSTNTSGTNTSGTNTSSTNTSRNVAVGDAKGHIHVVSNSRVVQTVETGSATVLQLIALDATRELIALTDDGELSVYPVVNGRLGPARAIGTNGFVAVAVSANGQWVAYQRQSGRVEILRVADGRSVGVVKFDDRGAATVPTDAGVEVLAFNDDATSLAVGFDGSVQLMNLSWKGQDGVASGLRAILPVEAKPVGIGYAGTSVIVADSDGFVSSFDATTGEPLGAVQAFLASRDADLSHGPTMVFELAGEALVIRDVTPEAIRLDACAVLWRPLSKRERTRFDIAEPAAAC